MIFDRLRRAIREQNWFAVVLEICIVVLGVFLGLQVNNWNAARLDREREHLYLERIGQDLEKDMQEIDSRIGYWRAVANHGRAALGEPQPGGAVTSDWDKLLSYYYASQVNPFNTNATAFDELNNSGNLSLIRDSALRTEISAYYQRLRRREETLYDFKPDYRGTVRGAIPLAVQTHVWSTCYTPDMGSAGFADCSSPVDPETVANILEAIESDPTVRRQLRFWITNLEIASDIATRDREFAERTRQSVRQANRLL
jgi:hypothetical protein